MENSRGQNHPNGSKEQQKRNTMEDTGKSMTNRRTHGTVDMDPQESVASNNIQTRGSGLSTKRNVTGSDYDGQNAGE